jgi:guanylate kinase
LNKGRVIVILGPSGVGKTTICKKILEHRQKDIRFSISATSRPKRKDEDYNNQYIFLTQKEFQEWIKKGRFIEYAEVHGNLYGTPKKPLEDNLNKGFHVLLDVDVQGAMNLKKLYPKGLYFFIVPPDMDELKERLKKRNTDKQDVIMTRLANALEEFRHKDKFKYVIENRKLEDAVKEILSIIEKELGS